MSELKFWGSILSLVVVIGLVIGGSMIYFYLRSFEKRMDEISRIRHLPLEELYNIGPKRNFEFRNFERATKIEVYHPSVPTFQMTIEDTKKVDLAKQYIQNHSDNWAQIRSSDGKIPFTPCSLMLQFYIDNIPSDKYTIASDRALIYGNLSTGHWKLVDQRELKALAKSLNIPEELLYTPRDSDCFSNNVDK